MKKSILRITMVLLLLAAIVPSTSARDKAPLKPATEVEAKVWLSRLDEINAMDKSTLNRSEKRSLRKEVRVIEKNLNGSGGVYLSVGAIIIIILLLIILL